jgi:hypothetical protein
VHPIKGDELRALRRHFSREGGTVGSRSISFPKADAVAQGVTRYFDGTTCVHGHIAERCVGNNGCILLQQDPEESLVTQSHKRKRDRRDKLAIAAG